MRRLVRYAASALTLFLLAAMPAGSRLLVQTAQAQYTPEAGYELAWSLDPRSDTDLFPRGPAFGARSVYVGMDFDNDGNKEILFTMDETLAPGGPDPGYQEIFLYENDGDNSYTHVWHYTHTDPSNSLPAVAWGDIDGDGLQEIYFGFPTSPLPDPNRLFVFEQNGDLSFPDTPTTTWDYDRDPSLDFRPSGMQLADVDGDGKIELITTSRLGGARELVVAQLNGALDEFASWTIEFEAGEDVLGGGAIYDVDVEDFDNDGHMEIWVNTWDLFSLAIFEASAPNTYALEAEINQYVLADDPGSHNVHSFLFADIDNDGRDELIYPLTDGILYFLDDLDDVSTITGDSFDVVGRYGPPVARGAAIGDLDDDGNLDIVANTGTDEKIVRIEYQGVGDPADSTSYEWSLILDSSGDSKFERYYPLQIADEDLDGDDYREIVVSNIYASDEGQPIILVIEYTGGSTAVEPIDSTVPEELALRQNYPNPFTGRTTIEYAIRTTGSATVRVYNLVGQEVRTLVDDVHQPGTYRTSWDGRNESGQRVSSGTYIYTIEVEGTRTSRTLALIR